MRLHIPVEVWQKGSEALKTAVQAQVGKQVYSEVEINLDWIDRKLVNEMYELCKGEHQSERIMLGSYIKMLDEPADTATVGRFKAFGTGLRAYLQKDRIKGWVFQRESDGSVLPYAVTEIEYDEGNKRDKIPPSWYVGLAHNSTGSYRTSYKRLGSEQVMGNTILSIMTNSMNLVHEDPDLHAIYDKQQETYDQYAPMFTEQFTISGKALKESGSDHYSRSRYSSSREDYSRREESIVDSKAINVNEESLKRSRNSMKLLREDDDWAEFLGMDPKTKFEVPIHQYICFFSLKTHDYQWIHVNSAKPYVYNPALREQIVLPAAHRELIDVLTDDLDFFTEDFIHGKSAGTAILAHGPPGVGKTLTAEVYAEGIKRPLYMISSSQLGLSSHDIEKNLRQIFDRADRWNCVLLIDEVDVYVRKRGDDLETNAVVATFLRTLEYYAGLVFMTSNRVGDIDDAVLSRCIAVIAYGLLEGEDLKKLWQTLARVTKVALEDTVIDQLVLEFQKHKKSLAGRDIKMLLNLSLRFATAKKRKLDAEVIMTCAAFRNLI